MNPFQLRTQLHEAATPAFLLASFFFLTSIHTKALWLIFFKKKKKRQKQKQVSHT